MKINEMIDNNDSIKPGDVLMIETDTSALVGTVLGVKDGAVLIEGDVYPLDEHEDSYNFTERDIAQLERVSDLTQARKMAFDLISRPSKYPMHPDKVRWFKNQLMTKRSVQDIVKMMYDLLLSGEGNAVIGSRYSTAKNSYRHNFREDDNNVIRSLPRRQAEKNRTPYRYNADIAEQIPRYDSVKRRNIPAGFEMDNPNAVPYDHFEAVPVNDRIANIVGIAPDGGKVKVSTTTVQAAIALADAYNRGGFTDQDIQRVRFDEVKQRLDPKCWKGYRKQGTKVKDGVRVNNCVKVNETFMHVGGTLSDLEDFMTELKDKDFKRAIYDLDQIVVDCQERQMTPQDWADEIARRSKISGTDRTDSTDPKQYATALKNIETIRTILPNYEHEIIKALLERIKDVSSELVKDDVEAIVEMLKFLGADWPSLDRVAAAAVKALPDMLYENDMDEEEEELYYDAINHMGNLYHALTDRKFTSAASYLSELGMLYQEAGVYLPTAIDMITDRRTKMQIERIYGLLDGNKDDVIRGILTLIKTGNESATSITNLISVLDDFGVEWPELNTLEAVVIKSLPNRLDEAEYQGRTVQLGKPTRGDVRKYKVFVKDPKTGNIKKVNFGDPNMEIKRDDPERRKSFRARHGCGTPRASDRTKAAYWSCRMWSSKPVGKILKGK